LRPASIPASARSRHCSSLVEIWASSYPNTHMGSKMALMIVRYALGPRMNLMVK
jgi:hypothetical protein